MSLLNSLFGERAERLDTPTFKLLLLANVMPAMGIPPISPIMSTLTGVYGVSGSDIGLMITAFTAPSVVMIPIMGVLADRFGRKPILLVGMVLFGLGGAAIGLTTDFTAVLGLRMIQGIGFGGMGPVIITSIGDLFEGDVEATAQGLRFGVVGATQMAVPVLTGFLVLFSWRYPFAVYLIGIPIAVTILLLLEEPREDTDNEVGVGIADRNSYLRELSRFVTNRYMLGLLTARAVPSILFIVFQTYNSFVVVASLGGTPQQAGFIVGAFSVTYAVVATQSGRIVAHFENRTVPIAGAGATMGVGLLVVAFAGGIAQVFFGGILTGAGFGSMTTLLRSTMTRVAPGHLRGGIVSLGESIGRLNATIAPLVAGVVIAVFSQPGGGDAAIRLVIAGAGVVGIGLTAVSILASRRLIEDSDYLISRH